MTEDVTKALEGMTAAQIIDPLDDLWHDYLGAATANGSTENGEIDIYDIDGMDEAAYALFEHGQLLRAELAAQTARADAAEARAADLTAKLEAMGWQPIENAPKDALIDIWLNEGKRWCDCYYDTICDEWRTSRPTGRLISIKSAHVSHWMPTPYAPIRAALKAGGL